MKKRFIQLLAMGLVATNVAGPFVTFAAESKEHEDVLMSGSDVRPNHDWEGNADDDQEEEMEEPEDAKPEPTPTPKPTSEPEPVQVIAPTPEKENPPEDTKKVLTEGILMSDSEIKNYIAKINKEHPIKNSLTISSKDVLEESKFTAGDDIDNSIMNHSAEIIANSNIAIKNAEKEGIFIPFRSYFIPYLMVHSGESNNSLVPALWCRTFVEERDWKEEGTWIGKYGLDYTDSNGNKATTKGGPVAYNTKYDHALAEAFKVKDSELTSDNVSLFNAMYANCPDILAGYLKNYKDHPEVTNAIIEYFNNSYSTVYSYENNDIGLYLLNIFAHNYSKLSPRLEKYTKKSCLAPLAFAYMQDDKRIVISKEETPEVYDLVARSRYAATFSTYNRYENLLFPNKGNSTELDADKNRALHQEFYAYVINSGKGFGDFIYQAWTGDGFKYPGTTESADPDAKINTEVIYEMFDSDLVATDNNDFHSRRMATLSKDFMHQIESLDQLTKVKNFSFKGNIDNFDQDPGNDNTNIVLWSWLYYQMWHPNIFNSVNFSTKGIEASDVYTGLDKIWGFEDIGVSHSISKRFDKWINQIDKNYVVQVNYHLDGAESENPKFENIFGLMTTFPIEEVHPVKKGYTFDGLYLDKNFTIPVTRIMGGWTYMEDDRIKQPKKIYASGKNTVDVYAKYSANTYNVTIDTDGGTTTTALSSALKVGDTIKVEDPIKEGYIFKGWTVIGDKASFNNGIFKQGVENTTLKANWEVAKCKITYQNADGRTIEETHNYGDKVTINLPQKAGYKIIGYNVNTSSADKGATDNNSIFTEKENIISSNGGSIEQVTFTVNGNISISNYEYTGKTYTVTLHYKQMIDGKLIDGTTTVSATYNEEYRMPDPIKVDGLVFKNWYTKTGNGVGKDSIVNIPSNHDLYAKYNGKLIAVTLDKQNATSAGTTNVTAMFGDEMPEIALPSRKGYTFEGYFTGKNGTGKKYYNGNGSSASIMDIPNATTFYAHIRPNRYKIVFHANNGTGNMSEQNMTYDTAKNLTNVGFSRNKFTFEGWSTSPTDRSGPVTYANKQNVLNLTDKDGGVIHLYAVWKHRHTGNSSSGGGCYTVAHTELYQVEVGDYAQVTVSHPADGNCPNNGWYNGGPCNCGHCRGWSETKMEKVGSHMETRSRTVYSLGCGLEEN